MTDSQPLLFDLDGCIVDSLASIVRCWTETLPHFGLEVPAEAVMRANVGPPVDEAARRYAPDADAATLARIVAAYRGLSAQATDVQPFPGMVDLLERLHAAGVPLGIATSKSAEVTAPTLGRLGLTGLFSVIEATREDEAGTDKTTIVGRAVAAFSPRLPRGLVGDRRHDVVGAHAHGLEAIGVLWGYGGETELREAGADALVASPTELAALLGVS